MEEKAVMDQMTYRNELALLPSSGLECSPVTPSLRCPYTTMIPELS